MFQGEPVVLAGSMLIVDSMPVAFVTSTSRLMTCESLSDGVEIVEFVVADADAVVVDGSGDVMVVVVVLLLYM